MCLAQGISTAPHLAIVVDATHLTRGYARASRNLGRLSNPDLQVLAAREGVRSRRLLARERTRAKAHTSAVEHLSEVYEKSWKDATHHVAIVVHTQEIVGLPARGLNFRG